MLFRPKTAERDFTPDRLPQNRREIFFDVCRLHTRKLLLCGVILLLFALPMHLTAIVKDVAMLTLDAGGGLTAAALNRLAGVQTAASVVCLLPLSVGAAGVARVVKLLAWEENTYVGSDFGLGVRQNTRQYLAMLLLGGIPALACWYVLQAQSASPIAWLTAAACLLVLAPLCAYMGVCAAVYQVRFSQLVRYAAILYGKNIFPTLLACLVCALPYLVQCVPNLLCHAAGRVISTLLTPTVMLGWFLFSFDRLDVCINRDWFPELVGRGIGQNL